MAKIPTIDEGTGGIDYPQFRPGSSPVAPVVDAAAPYNAAAKTFVPDSFIDPYNFYKFNINSSLNILREPLVIHHFRSNIFKILFSVNTQCITFNFNSSYFKTMF